MKNAVSGLGLAPDAAMATFPLDMFLPNSDISLLERRKRVVYEGLTHWKCNFVQVAPGESALHSVEGVSYEDALIKVNNYLLSNLWGDGLPLWPATRERVDWILKGSALPRTQLLGKFPPRGGVTTVETCAIALAMAGGRPEYLPVLLAAVDACLNPDSKFEQLHTASGSPFPVLIVNGPIAKKIRLNSGFGCLGPNPQQSAGASIGRALHLLQQNVGGAVAGIGSVANYGAMRYTNLVLSEDEEGLPEGWLPHSTERHGYAQGLDSVSLVFANGVANIRRHSATSIFPEQMADIDEIKHKINAQESDTLQGMYRIASFMRVLNLGALLGWDRGAPGVVMIPRVVAKTMASLGWTKQSIREFLWENSRIPIEELRRSGVPALLELDANPVTRASIKLDPWPIARLASNIVLIVAGGSHPTNACWLQGMSPSVTGRPIFLPAKFQELLLEADKDLGCGSEECLI